MKLVSDARQAWRWFSIQAFVAIAALQAAWAALPPEGLSVIPAEWRGYVTLGLALAGAVGRLIPQDAKK
jgi:hypothetical protein